jgi:hypothetical protein
MMTNAEILHIHISTKDRTVELARLLNDIGSVIPLHKKVFIYDDSIQSANRISNAQMLSSMPYDTVYIDETRRAELLRQLPWPSMAAREYAQYAFKKLGKPAWDHAGVRAFAHFIAGTQAQSANEKVLFLDDDISLTGGTFRGRYYAVDPELVRATLTNPLPTKHIVGAKYAGRADVTLSRHLKEGYPTKLNPENSLTVAPGISASRNGRVWQAMMNRPSGAFLMVHGEDIRCAPIPHCYNEDLIFITFLAASGRRSGIAPFRPLHAGDNLQPSVEVGSLQQVGIVVLQAIHSALKEHGMDDFPGFIEATVSHCEQFAQEQTILWKDILSQEGGFGSINAERIQVLLDQERIRKEATEALRNYFAVWTGWHSLTTSNELAEYLRNNLKS